MSYFMPMPMDPSQIIMFPISVEDSLPPDCDVRLVGEAMDALDWRGFESAYADTGRPPYPPRVMCKLLVYGYSKGIRSSRALEEVVKHDQRYIWLAGGLRPDHSTIARFRKEHEPQLKAIYQATVRLCTEAGLVLLAVTATDGSKIPARASKRSLYDAKRLAREMAAIDQILAEAEAADQAEDELYGEGANGKLPQTLADAKRRRDKLAEIAARLSESGRKRVAASEEDCRVMKTTQGLRPSYNAQLTVDATHGVIVAADLTQQETDNGQLAEQLEQVTENVGCRPDVALADTGYSDEGTFKSLTESGQEALIPPKQQPQEAKRNDLFASRCFLPDDRRDVLICPAGQELTFRRVVECSSGSYRVYTAADCRGCSFYAECVKVESKRGRSVQVSVVAAEREGMRQKLKTPEGKALYQLRQQTVERVIGRVKVGFKLDRFLLEGMVGAGAEWWLVCSAHNLLTYLRAAGAAANRAVRRPFVRLAARITSLFRCYRRHFCPIEATLR